MIEIRRSISCAVAMLAFGSALGCGPAERDAPVAPPPAECVDADMDGFGQGCEEGPDCDDDDAEVTIECVAGGRAADQDAGNAECLDGWRSACVLHVDAGEGMPLCFWGESVCRDGEWGPCELLEDE